MPGPINLAHVADEPMRATEEPIFDPANDDDDGDDDDDDTMTNDAGRCMHDKLLTMKQQMHDEPSWFEKGI